MIEQVGLWLAICISSLLAICIISMIFYPEKWGNREYPRLRSFCNGYSLLERIKVTWWRGPLRKHCWHNQDNPQCCRCGKYHPDYHKEN